VADVKDGGCADEECAGQQPRVGVHGGDFVAQCGEFSDGEVFSAEHEIGGGADGGGQRDQNEAAD
jgi:hypothetical protein